MIDLEKSRHVHPRHKRLATPKPYRPLFGTTGPKPTNNWRRAESAHVDKDVTRIPVSRKRAGRAFVQKHMRTVLGITRRQLDAVRGLVRRGQADDLVAALKLIRAAHHAGK